MHNLASKYALYSFKAYTHENGDKCLCLKYVHMFSIFVFKNTIAYILVALEYILVALTKITSFV